MSTFHLSPNIDLVNAVKGGLILGVSSSGLLYFTGAITGISGIVEGVLLDENSFFNLSYVLGLLSSGVVATQILPEAFGSSSLSSPSTLVLPIFIPITAGLLTGFGTRMGSGCTSGHGICGLPRLSPRSLVAVLTFMATGSLSAYCTRQYVSSISLSAPAPPLSSSSFSNEPIEILTYLAPTLMTTTVSVIYSKLLKNNNKQSSSSSKPASPISYHIASFASAFIFGIGLAVSGMCNPNRVSNFLDFMNPSGWDPSLMGVMGSGVCFNLISFYFMSRPSAQLKPLLSTTTTTTATTTATGKAINISINNDQSKLQLSSILKMGMNPVNLKIDKSLLMGSALFGLGSFSDF